MPLAGPPRLSPCGGSASAVPVGHSHLPCPHLVLADDRVHKPSLPVQSYDSKYIESINHCQESPVDSEKIRPWMLMRAGSLACRSWCYRVASRRKPERENPRCHSQRRGRSTAAQFVPTGLRPRTRGIGSSASMMDRPPKGSARPAPLYATSIGLDRGESA